VVRSYQGEVWGLAAIEIVFSVGMIAGGLLVLAWGGFRNRAHTMDLCGIAMPLGMLVYGPLADAVPIEWLLLATGAGLVLTGLAILLSRSLLAHGEPRVRAEPGEGIAQ
jgi:hypothetical protein